MTKNKNSQISNDESDEKSVMEQMSDNGTEFAKLIMTQNKNAQNIDIQQKNNLLQDQAYVCSQSCNPHDNGFHIHCCNNLVKYVLLVTWQALCIILGILAIYTLWNGNFLNILDYWGLPAPEGKEQTLILFGYAFFAGWVGSATYAVCAAFNHIVSPRGNAFTSQDDQSEEKDLKQVAISTGVYSEKEENLNNRLRKEQRRFCGENIPYWICRPLLGGIGGIFGCLLIQFFDSSLRILTTSTTTGFVTDTTNCTTTTTVVNAKGYAGIAFISGMFVGDFVKAVGKLSKKLFGLEAKDEESKTKTDTDANNLGLNEAKKDESKPTNGINVNMNIEKVELKEPDAKKGGSKK